MLEKILAEMVDVAQQSPIIIHEVLEGGLHIYLKHSEEGFHLAIMRQKVKPSFRDWNILLSNWPWPVEIVKPRQAADERGINFFMTAVIPDRGVAWRCRSEQEAESVH